MNLKCMKAQQLARMVKMGVVKWKEQMGMVNGRGKWVWSNERHKEKKVVIITYLENVSVPLLLLFLRCGCGFHVFRWHTFPTYFLFHLLLSSATSKVLIQLHL